SQTRASPADIVEHEGGGWYPTLDWVGVRGTGPPTCPRAASGARARLGRGRRGCLVERGTLDLPHLVRLDEVAFLDVVVALEVDAALETLGHLARVVLEAPQRVDRRLVDDGAVANDAGARAAADRPACDVGAGDRAETRDPDQGAHLGLAERH